MRRPHPRTTRNRLLTLLALAVAGLMTAVGISWAAIVTDNMVPVGTDGAGAWGCRVDPDGGDGSTDCWTDNSNVYYYMDSGGEFRLEDVDKANVRSALSTEYSPTHLAIHYDADPVFSGSAETDIVYQEGSKNLDADSAGVTWCNGVGSGRYDCDQQYIRIRGYDAYTKGRVCHETGHAVGLQHGSASQPSLGNQDTRLGCLQTPSAPGDHLGSNNKDHINAVYPAP
ncbi:hypothetical protein [Streptomyces melanosporofaciens]|uniref:Matrixin n=1 Tax=Streptomyces melanosporofaciens TaxID=67327 RepID=A0A1H4VSJ3_STRMJ|nr:hypothetical protein [Streptomyces melanosporofaciens]SEC83488.1 hypothetical protein SAMN04490356_5719 [Streptomyces melanosporofaciens]